MSPGPHPTVAIQGGPASFHDIAARQLLGEVQIVDCAEFRQVCEKVVNGQVDLGLMAIENAIAGSILSNYKLMDEYPSLHVVGEIKLRVQLDLMALPGQKIEDIGRVMSHYMALLQCEEFLGQYPDIEVEKYHDTADSALWIQDHQEQGVAAIASTRAAELYGMEVLASSIETEKMNYTRFLLLSTDRDRVKRSDRNKAMLSFQTSHSIGSLAKALQVVVDHKLNLTKIQSVPVLGKPDEYRFYLDCTWEEYGQYATCLNRLKELVDRPIILGEFTHNDPIHDCA